MIRALKASVGSRVYDVIATELRELEKRAATRVDVYLISERWVHVVYHMIKHVI